MPRPKVKPEDRQRSVRACVPCKASKIRCDAAVPCGPCSKRDRIPSCVYLESSSRKRPKRHHVSAEDGDSASPAFQGRSAHLTPAQDDVGVETARGPKNGGQVRATPPPGQVVSRLTESRMLLTTKGEKVYVGASASLSFLQFLRQILRNYMGPSSFTEHQLKDSMLEVETVHDESPVQTIQTRAETLSLVQLYREASSGILDLYTASEISHFLDSHDASGPAAPSLDPGASPDAKAERAALDMMIAIGFQCRGRRPADRHRAARSFTRAQRFAFDGFLCDPSLDMVRVFIMMSFYMAQACHRNAAYMYTGIASKAACALGLHRREEYKGLSRQDVLSRWRTWKSLVILDTIISSILGRPGSVSSLHPDDATRFNAQAPPDDASPAALSSVPAPPASSSHTAPGAPASGSADRTRWLSSRAVFAICSHLLELQQQLGGEANVDVETAEAFLHRLREWDEALPAELRHFVGGGGTGARHHRGAAGPVERELFMGATHVSCLYYFTTILVTRPFLIARMMGLIAVKQQQQQGHDTGNAEGRKGQRKRGRVEERGDGEGGDKIADLAQACLDAALFLARTGYMAITSSLLSNNMCLLKAWMFAAGLVLGFSMFIDAAEPVPEIDEAFAQATHVLERLAEASPQARHYFEIMTGLHEAVSHRRHQLARERKRKSGRYVSQIFTAEFPGSESVPPAGSVPATGRMDGLGHVAGKEDSARRFEGVSQSGNSNGLGVPRAANAPDSYRDLDPLTDSNLQDWSGHIDAWVDIPLLSDNLYFDWGGGDGLMRF